MILCQVVALSLSVAPLERVKSRSRTPSSLFSILPNHQPNPLLLHNLSRAQVRIHRRCTYLSALFIRIQNVAAAAVDVWKELTWLIALAKH